MEDRNEGNEHWMSPARFRREERIGAVKLRILGAAGSETPEFSPPGYLLNADLLLDAGTAASVLSDEEQRGLRWILISHAHLDHIKDIPFLADNRLMGSPTPASLALLAPGDVLETIHTHVLNDEIWPDFTRIPNSAHPTLRFEEVVVGAETTVGDYRIMAIPMNHVVPAYGYRISVAGRTVVYSGDTGPTERLWAAADGADVLIVEVSFPDDMESLALQSGHMTPALLHQGLQKVRVAPGNILVVHAKPAFRERIARELANRSVPARLVGKGDLFEI